VEIKVAFVLVESGKKRGLKTMIQLKPNTLSLQEERKMRKVGKSLLFLKVYREGKPTVLVTYWLQTHWSEARHWKY